MLGYEEEPTGEDLDAGLGMEGDAGAGGDLGTSLQDGQAELEAMRAKLQEMENEANKLREMQAKVEKEAGLAPQAQPMDAGAKEEADSRSVYVGNVDYGCTPEELQLHFQTCGTVNRVTILTDKFGNAKGYAYIEFLEADAVQSALLLDNTELRSRQIKVSPKRTNVPGMKIRGGFGGRGRGPPWRGGGRGYGRGGYYGGYGYGFVPRGGRGRGRWYPY